MTTKKAIEKGFTHSGYMFEYIPVYFKLEEDDGFQQLVKTLYMTFYLKYLLHSIHSLVTINLLKYGKMKKT